MSDATEAVRPLRASALGRPLLWLALLLVVGTGSLSLVAQALPAALVAGSVSLLLATLGAGVAFQGSGVFARPLIAARTSRPEVALTFDDGPDPVHTRTILDVLEARGHRGTFFVIGQRGSQEQALLQEIAARGHALGNHSFRHAYLTTLTNPGVLASELRQTSDLIERATGQRCRWFRPPVGLLSPRVVKAAHRCGLELVGWTATARDGGALRDAPRALARLRPHLRPGAILVLHDALLDGGSPIAPTLLAAVLDDLAERGLRSVTLDRLVS